MEISIIQYLIVCPLVFLAGFVDAVAGGGGLISLPAYLIAGFPVHFAIGTNKVSSAMGTTLKTTLLSCTIAFIIGAYDGFYGPGTGTFLILLLTAAAHMPVTEANGVSKAINLATNISALVVFLINGKVIFAVGLVAGLFSIAGNWLGSSFFKKGGSKAVKPIMICVLVIFFVKVLGEVIG